MSLLSVEQLSVAIRGDDGIQRELVSAISFAIASGRTMGLVGESGCGKSLTAMAILDLLPKPQALRSGGKILFNGDDLSQLSNKALRQIRGHKIAVIFQDPMSALNPVQQIGRQIMEVLKLHFPKQSNAIHRARVLELLTEVGIPAPAERLNAYPHQLSGGMRQRVMIAMALACEPELLIADEPTTALDVTIQAQIVRLLKKLQAKNGMAMLFITHDLALVSQLSDHIAVMYAGKIVEYGPAAQIFSQARHPYTQGLLASLPGAGHPPKSRLHSLEGQVPAVDNMPAGCRFANRCRYAQDICQTPPANEIITKRADSQEEVSVACHLWRSISP
ncbi:MAG: peptide/nickel transport system ATP-binding protein [Zhongshania aliphaticivorans]|jgi:peptide/nickel transport system ATP-binding protein|uniref:ABC transporter ATP-binding protein n=1 Tax=Zhongshania aliphaticivorans TaxID=1470434 RepID=UPI0039E5C844|tara:strand:- start:13040 stop:14038 length:999 start_codon:yes stop_codon:yes gene_type:complete